MKKYNSNAEHLRDIRRKNYMFKVKNELISTSTIVATVLIALVIFTSLISCEPQVCEDCYTYTYSDNTTEWVCGTYECPSTY